MKKIIFVFILVTLPLYLYTDIYFMKGNTSIIKAKAYLVHTISLNKESQKLNSSNTIEITLYKFKTFSNGQNKQIITDYKPTIFPKPQKLTPFVDNLGNSGYKIQYNSSVSKIVVNSNFTISSSVDAFPIKKFYPYPLRPSEVNYVSNYLIESPLSKNILSELKLLTDELTKTSKNQTSVILNILGWINHKIDYNPNILYNNAEKTFLYKQGNRNGIINLSLAMLRMAGLPSRCVHGISIDRSYPISFGKKKIEIRYPKSLYKWIEIYSPYKDWLPFDPMSSYFFIPPNLIKRNVSLYSDSMEENVINMNKVTPLNFQLFIDKQKENNYLSVNNSLNNEIGYYFFPTFSSSGYKMVKKLFSHSKYVNPKKKQSIIELLPKTMDFNNNHEQIDLTASSGYFFQRVLLDKSFKLKKIALPLFRYNRTPVGKLWIEAYEDDEHGMPSKKLIIKSNTISINKLNNYKSYKWLSFSFDINAKTSTLKQKAIWITLKYDSDEVILWKSIFANPFQKMDDSIFYYSGQVKPTTLYLDLCFKLIGHNIKEEKPK